MAGHSHPPGGHSHGDEEGAHAHARGHTHVERGLPTRRLGIAIGINAVIFGAEVAGGLLTGSLALLSDAGHNLTDVGALVVAYFAARFATLPATRRKSFGYYRLEILSALGNGITLVVVSLLILVEGFRRFRDPPAVPGALVLLFAVIGLVGNVLSAVILARDRNRINIHAAYLHLLADSVSSVGVILAGIAIIITGNPLWDVVAAVLIAILIVLSSYHLLRETLDILLQGVPRDMELASLKTAICGVPHVLGCHDLHVWSLTSGEHVATVHVVVERDRLADSDAIAHAVSRRLHEEFSINHTTVQVESPDYEEVGRVHD